MTEVDTSIIDSYYGQHIGRAFFAKPTHPNIEKHRASRILYLATFVPTPDISGCFHYARDVCNARKFVDRERFTVEAMVEPVNKRSDENYPCPAHQQSCFYRVRFADNSISFVPTMGLIQAAKANMALAYNVPGLHQVEPENPTRNEQIQSTFNSKEFRKRGVQLGFSHEDVLKSSWGKPLRKNTTTMPSMKMETWSYSSSNYLIFVDGVLESISN